MVAGLYTTFKMFKTLNIEAFLSQIYVYIQQLVDDRITQFEWTLTHCQ